MPLSTNGERINEWVAPRMRVVDFLDLCSCVCIYRLREHEIARLGDYVIVSFARSPVRPFARCPFHVRPFARSPVRPFARCPFHVLRSPVPVPFTLSTNGERINECRRALAPRCPYPETLTVTFPRSTFPRSTFHVPTFHVPTFPVPRSTFYVPRSPFHVSSAATHRSAANPSP